MVEGQAREVRFTAAEAAAACGGRLVAGPPDAVFTGAASDSRKVKGGDLFVAIPGERVDGHAYVAEAVARGATGALVQRPVEGPPGAAVIVVEEAVAALGKLAAAYRQRFRLPVVGVTGSVGKTTTKDLVAGVLERRFDTLATEGNLNTEVGLPLTVLELERHHQAAVFELAMRGIGEIAYLSGIAKPSVGLVTNIGLTHLELLGSVENIARAKAELIEALPPDGLAVLNGDDPRCREVAHRSAAPVVYYGRGTDCQVRAVDFQTRGEEGVRVTVALAGDDPGRVHEVTVPIPGLHTVGNALAAIAVGRSLGMTMPEIAAGLAEPRRTAMRLEVHHEGGVTIIDDTYNAGPASTRAALEILRELSVGGRSLAVLGTMLELGSAAEAGHEEVGLAAREAGVDHLVTVGDLGAIIGRAAVTAGLDPARVTTCGDNRAAAAAAMAVLRPGDTVLVKGSRGMKMEEIVAALRGSLARG
jgi:UDP-N-acetylmuramoyl-tripeptide--D-alanyl-D-alanine ligase